MLNVRLPVPILNELRQKIVKTCYLAALAALLAFSVACTSQSDRSAEIEPVGKLSATQALEVARRAVAENDTWLDRAEFESPQRNSENAGWSVMVWRLPKTPGGHRLIEIDDAGKVIAYHRGK